MIISAFILLLSRVVVASNPHSARNLVNFQSMIYYMTNRSAWDYHNYGKWCGFGGSGTPVDDVDRCCQAHDHCYDDLNVKECKGLMNLRTYYVIYKWGWINNQIACADSNRSIIADNDGECSEKLCRCDKEAAECFSRYEYRQENKNTIWNNLPSLPEKPSWLPSLPSWLADVDTSSLSKWWDSWSLPSLPSWFGVSSKNDGDSTFWGVSWIKG